MIFKANSLKGLLINVVIMIIILIMLILLFFYAYLPSSTNHGETITVPNLKGIHINEIDEFLTKRDLRVEVSEDSGFNADKPALTILKQYPKPNSKVKEKRKIYITLNAQHPPLIKMPDLVNTSLKNALVVLESYGLKDGKKTYKSSTFHNLILGMEMNGEEITEEDSVYKGSTIDLIVGTSGGSRRMETPEIIGFEYGEALFIVKGMQLNIESVFVDDESFENELLKEDSIPAGIIIKQIPPPFETIYSGQSVDIWLSTTDTTQNARDSTHLNE